jgi:hypothetical protein
MIYQVEVFPAVRFGSLIPARSSSGSVRAHPHRDDRMATDLWQIFSGNFFSGRSSHLP